jgi:hypothetical protein
LDGCIWPELGQPVRVGPLPVELVTGQDVLSRTIDNFYPVCGGFPVGNPHLRAGHGTGTS